MKGLNKMQEEIWKKLPIGDKYEISNYGRVKTYYRSENGRLIYLAKDKLGYINVRLYCLGKTKHYKVHRLVALMFVPNPFMYNEINHIDGNKENNYFENLEWCTHQQNMRHAWDVGLSHSYKGSQHHSAKSFYQFDLEGNLIKKWDCIEECAKYLWENDEYIKSKFSNHKSFAINISHCLHRKHQTCGGYIFGFTEKAPQIEYKERDFPIIAIDVKTGEKYEYKGIQKVSKTILPNGKKPIATIITKCCKGIRKSHAGYYWKYNKNKK